MHSSHPDIIFIQEAFVGRPLPVGEAPSLNGYVSYVHLVRNGLVTYVHSSVQHTLIRNSVDVNTTYQLLEVTVVTGKTYLCNVYAAPGMLNPTVLPVPMDRSMIYLGDINARHPALGDTVGTINRSGTKLLQYIYRNHLTRWGTVGATHARGGTLDHIITAGLVASRVKCSSIPALFSDHIALNLHYSLPATPTPKYSRSRIVIPPKYCPTYVSYISSLLPTFDLRSPEELYLSLVNSTHDFYTQYVSRPHIKRRPDSHTWTLDDRTKQAERQAVEDGLTFQ